ncbi:hypothetical protein SAMN04488082_10452 [Desulfomicrobium apsheronum]|uniref:Uncharacterized protein n=1 Tax=Desulfomicrobium apsheronum TaxID=52560 RepID=A0A1I3SAP5_9BACT|nr:hypothetical protein SAMN04488082_10452 [Desulfomicrobium apsheronum]
MEIVRRLFNGAECKFCLLPSSFLAIAVSRINVPDFNLSCDKYILCHTGVML